jgi:lipopolysaccharide cholinephosphotransferase
MKDLVNPENEIRDGYFISHEMKKVWNIQLDMFQKLIDVCKQYNLRIWCDGGTLLGAIRHHGYIPWDDDIDLCMPRPDYDRLQEISPKVFREPYFFQTAKTDKHYYRGHAQLRRSDTAAIRPSDSYRPFNQGIFIDIFAFEGVPDDESLLNEGMKEAGRRMKGLKSIDYSILFSGRIGLIFRKYKWKWLVHKHGFYNLFKPIEDIYRQYTWDDCNRVAQLGIDGTRYILPKSIFDETLEVDFEMMKVPVPVGYDQFLRTQYGNNYMTPLHVNTNHGQLVIDTSHSYLELMPSVRRAYRWRWLSKRSSK